MKRYFILGGVCLVAGFALNTCMHGLVRSEPAAVLAERMASKSPEAFGAADEAMQMAPAAPPPMQVAAPAPSRAGGKGSAGVGVGDWKDRRAANEPGAPSTSVRAPSAASRTSAARVAFVPLWASGGAGGHTDKYSATKAARTAVIAAFCAADCEPETRSEIGPIRKSRPRTWPARIRIIRSS